MVKSSFHYDFRKINKDVSFTLTRRGSKITLHKGCQFGIRSASSSDSYRVILPGQESIIYSVDFPTALALHKVSK